MCLSWIITSRHEVRPKVKNRGEETSNEQPHSQYSDSYYCRQNGRGWLRIAPQPNIGRRNGRGWLRSSNILCPLLWRSWFACAIIIRSFPNCVQIWLVQVFVGRTFSLAFLATNDTLGNGEHSWLRRVPADSYAQLRGAKTVWPRSA